MAKVRPTDRQATKESSGRFTWIDFAMTIVTLGFATYLIESQRLPVISAVLTALGTVAGIVFLILLPKTVREMADRLRLVNNAMMTMNSSISAALAADSADSTMNNSMPNLP